MKCRFALAATATLLAALGAAPASAGGPSVIFVTSTADSGPGTLRQAIADSPASGTIGFDAPLSGRTITLTSGQLAIAKNLTIDGTLRVSQQVSISGGGLSRVFHVSAATVGLYAVTIRDGSGTSGGGIFVEQGATVELVLSTVAENRATQGGGGIRNDGTLTITASTISNNTAVASFGGGIDNVFGGQLTVVNSTISGNRAGLGGGLDNYGAGSTATLTNTTIAFNLADFEGGGVFRAVGDHGTITLQGSILGENDAPLGPDCSAVVSSGGYNLVSRTAGCTIGGTTTGNLTGVAPHLGGLMPNGRPGTLTHALLAGSPAVDAIPTESCAAMEDQRFVTRPADGDADATAACDMGAYERTRPIVVNSLADPGEEGKCTLRGALTAAVTNAPSGGCEGGVGNVDTVLVAVDGTLRIASVLSLSSLAQSVEVVGPGADRLLVSKVSGGALFSLEATPGGEVAYTLSGLRLAGGGNGTLVSAGAATTLGLDRCVLEENRNDGGHLVIALDLRRLEVRDTTFVLGPMSNGVLNDIGVAASNVKRAAFTSCTFESALGSAGSSQVQVLASGAGKTTEALFTSCTFRGTSGWGLRVGAGGGAEAGSAVARYRSTVFDGFDESVELGNGTGTGVSLGYNVSSDATGNLVAEDDAPSTDPKLGRLRWNGGPVPTIGLLAGSPAVDRVPFFACRAATDARGVSRMRDGSATGTRSCDSGAFEATRPIVVNSLLDPADPGSCTLRDALAAASTNTVAGTCAAGSHGLDTIAFAPALTGTITLGAGRLVVDESVLVDGPGAHRLAVSANGLSGVFDFASGDTRNTFALAGLTVRNGTAQYGGGVRFNNAPDDSLAVDRCDFRDNVATGTGTGAALDHFLAGPLHVSASTFRNDGSASEDEGVATGGRTVAWFSGCTFAESKSNKSAFAVSTFSPTDRAEATLTHCTFSGTEPAGVAATTEGGAAALSAVVFLRASVLRGYGANVDTALGGLAVSLGHNVSDDASGDFVGAGDLTETDPMLAALVLNGGTTPTFALKAASPAVGLLALSACRPAFDQRGLARPSGAGCDSGAFERTPVGDANGDGSVNVGDVFYLISYLFAAGPAPVGSANVNDDAAVSVGDVFYLINFLFAAGPSPV